LKLTKEAAEAFTSLRGDHRFEVVLKYVADHRDIARQECVDQLEHPKVLRAQGRAKALDEFLDNVVEAPQVLEKFKSQKS
jgi:hypothetical protein